jgi:hypothetical protein
VSQIVGHWDTTRDTLVQKCPIRIAMYFDGQPQRGTLGHFFLFFSKNEKKEQGQREHGVEIAARGNKEDSSVPVSLDE